MERINDVKTTTQYQHGEFIVTIFEYEAGSVVWLSHEDYGVARLMFGVAAKGKDLLDMIKACIDDYEASYREHVMD